MISSGKEIAKMATYRSSKLPIMLLTKCNYVRPNEEWWWNGRVGGSQDFIHTGGTGLFHSCLPEIVLTLKGQREDSSTTVYVNSDGSDKQVLIVGGKSMEPHCFKNKQKTSCVKLCK